MHEWSNKYSQSWADFFSLYIWWHCTSHTQMLLVLNFLSGRFGGNTDKGSVCKPTKAGRRTERNFGELCGLRLTAALHYNDLDSCKLQTIHCVREEKKSSVCLFSYASICFSTPFSLCSSPPKNLPLQKISNKAVPWWSRWEAGWNKADLVSAWAAALILFQVKSWPWKVGLQNSE